MRIGNFPIAIRRVALASVVLGLLNLAVLGQTREQQAAEAERVRQHQKTLDEQGRKGREADYQARMEVERRNIAITAFAKTFYRNATSTELEAVAVDPNDIDYYSNLRLGTDSGILRLLPPVRCGESNETEQIRQWCVKFSMPGNGSRYSFRERKYRMARLADIALEGDFLKSGSFRTLGFL
jgi:hypothetical protein